MIRRIASIIDTVVARYEHMGFTNEAKKLMFNDVSAVIRGIDKVEDIFSDITIDKDNLSIAIFGDEEKGMELLSLLPYINPELTETPLKYWLVYVADESEEGAYLAGSIMFHNLFEECTAPGVGIEVVYDRAYPIGMYNYATNEFFE